MKRLCIAMVALVSCVTMTAIAITQAEWEADHSLIPTPSASSAFYIVSPTAYAGAQSTDAVMVGYDATPAERVYDFSFGTDLKTYAPGMKFYFR